MFRITVWLWVGLCVCGQTSCWTTCPDGTLCADSATCCKGKEKYSCCVYPHAVCCSDMEHCCPSGYRCNLAARLCERENQPWMNILMVENEAVDDRSLSDRSVSPLQEVDNNLVPTDHQRSPHVQCDDQWACPDGTTCCKVPTGAWSCCIFSAAQCCLDGYHCCPYGYVCDPTYIQCWREGLRYPFTSKQPAASRPAFRISTSEDQGGLKETLIQALTEGRDRAHQGGVIRCDSETYCPGGSSCCRGPTGHWMCCPYRLGTCCADGRHCCQYGSNCTLSSAENSGVRCVQGP